MVAICDHLGLLTFAELEHEIRREALQIAFHLLVKTLGRHAVNHGQIRIQRHPVAANQQNRTLNSFNGNETVRFLHPKSNPEKKRLQPHATRDPFGQT